MSLPDRDPSFTGTSLTRIGRGSDPMPEDLRDACRQSVRTLLVVAVDRLSEEVESSLKESGWEPIYAQGGADALRLSQNHRFMVGLILLPHPFDTNRFREYRELVGTLAQMEWIAALDRTQIARDEVKRFIVDRLRDFQVFPIDSGRLGVVLGHACGLASIGHALRRDKPTTDSDRFGLIGSSPVMQELYGAIERVAAVNLPVLILGETGTGKEVVARAIHAQSERAAGPLVALNCSAIPTSLLQSELFGYEKGAFTSAFERKVGLIESASGGTLLLDEIGEMPPQAQASLLRFLENGEITPIGGTRTVSVDVRVIATTNRDLEQGVKDNSFREDLFYRLAVLTVRTPPLRERSGDVDALAHHFLELAATSLAKPIQGLTDAASSLLQRQQWPGNLRELRSTVFRAALESSGSRITRDDLRLETSDSAEPASSLNTAVDNAEKKTLQHTLSKNLWNVTKTAKVLGVSRMTLYRLMAKHQISRSLDANTDK
ncbi:MAG: sigma-54 dependent transcriptional regulator [Thiohalocapsa sp.]